MQRISIAAAILLIAQLVFAVYMNVQKDNVQNVSPQESFLDFAPDKITSIEISDNEEKTLLLNKKDNKWVLPAAEDLPADGEQIKKILSNLAEVKHGLAVSTTEEGIKRFHVGENNFEKHVLLKQENSVAANFFLGTSAGFRQTHAAAKGDKAVVSIAVNAFDFDTAPKQWLDKNQLNIAKDKVVQLSFPGFSLKKEQEKWSITVDGNSKEADKDEVAKLLDKATAVTVDDVASPDQAKALANKADFHYSLQLKDGSSKDFDFFSVDENTYAVKRSDIKYNYLVPKYVLEDLQAFTPTNFTGKKDTEKTAEAEAAQPEKTAAPAEEQSSTTEL